MKKYTLQEIVSLINKEILGIPTYGFEEKEKWAEFINVHFTREGTINGEAYSSDLNKVLSMAALSQGLTEIRLRLDSLLKRETEV